MIYRQQSYATPQQQSSRQQSYATPQQQSSRQQSYAPPQQQSSRQQSYASPQPQNARQQSYAPPQPQNTRQQSFEIQHTSGVREGSKRRRYRLKNRSVTELKNGEHNAHNERGNYKKAGEKADTSRSIEEYFLSGGPLKKIEKFIPESIYNPKTKKLLGLLTAEDLLLVALIFIFADSDSDDSWLMCLAILYILVSEYIDL